MKPIDREKNSLKRKLFEPISMSRFHKSLYEKIRDDNIAQINREWAELEKKCERGDSNSKTV